MLSEHPELKTTLFMRKVNFGLDLIQEAHFKYFPGDFDEADGAIVGDAAQVTLFRDRAEESPFPG